MTTPEKKFDDGGRAFPSPEVRNGNGDLVEYHEPGMSLRDWFAGQALAGILASEFYGEFADRKWDADFDYVETREQAAARKAYEFADAMLAARKGGES